MQQDNQPISVEKRQTAKAWIWRVARRNTGFILLLSLMGAVYSGSSVLLALLSKRVLDVATGEVQGKLLIAAAELVAMLLFQILLGVLSTRLEVWTTGKTEILIKDSVFASLFGKRWQEVSRYHSGDLMNRLISDTQVVVGGIVTLLPKVVSMFTRLIACLTVLLIMDPRFTLVVLIFGVIMLFASRLYGKRMMKLHKACQETDGEARSVMQESLENWMVIQSFEGGGFIRARLAEKLKAHFRNRMRRNTWNNFASAALQILFSGSYYAALLWGALRLATHTISYGTLTAFLQIVSQVRSPFVNMSGILPRYYNMLASADRLLELENLNGEYHLPQEIRTTLCVPKLYEDMECLRAEGLSFAYDPEHPVLTGTSLTVKKGEFIALAGFSGIGKSTLFKLLLGFYQPQEGSLSVVTGGTEIPLCADTRGLFAYVPQQNMLLSGTIRENITFCHPDAPEEAIWAAAEAADVAEVIRQLPDGLDTVLGERGTGLSEGQIQRLAIARALLGEAPILLLDEVTSSLDEQTEERVLRNLRAVPGKTCLCISHRPAALSQCDRVIRVVDGKIVED